MEHLPMHTIQREHDMSEAQFIDHGWLQLLVQPWAKRWADDDAMETKLRESYYAEIRRFPVQAWRDVVQKWITSQVKFPMLPEVLALLREWSMHEQQRLKRHVLQHKPAVHHKPPYGTAVTTWLHEGRVRPIHEVAHDVMQPYLAQHPGAASEVLAWIESLKRQGQLRMEEADVSADELYVSETPERKTYSRAFTPVSAVMREMELREDAQHERIIAQGESHD